jgi:hypothetical protein
VTLGSTAGEVDVVGKVKDGFPLSVKKALCAGTYAGLFASFVTGGSSGLVVDSAAGVEDTGGNVKDGFPSSVKKAVDGVATSDCFVDFSSTAGTYLTVLEGCS